jgi:mannose-6-phosphate isomerase-like protein (cupin superfamily)
MMTDAAKLLDSLRAYLAGKADAIPPRFLAGMGDSMPRRELQPKPLRCLRNLGRIAAIAGEAERALIGKLAASAGALHWGQTYTATDFGEAFVENYGWLEVFGTRGHFTNERVAAGLLILGPNLLYPDHHHLAEEIYIPLTGGTGWCKGGGLFVERDAGEVVHHPSNVSHAMRTGAEPLLALYLWQGGPLAQKSVIGMRSEA